MQNSRQIKSAFASLLVAVVLVASVLVASCKSPTSSSSSGSGSSSTSGLALAAAYGISTDLGSPKDADGVALADSYNPLGGKTATLRPRKEIFLSGVNWNGSGTGNGNHAVLIDESSTNKYPVIGVDSDESWIKTPHASASGDLDGTGYEKVVSVVFVPSSGSISTSADNAGTAKLEIVSKGTTTTYSRTEVTLSGTFHLVLPSASETKYYAMSIALGDIDGDGRDEIAVAVGNTLVILDDAKASYAVLNTVDYRSGTYTDHANFRATTVAAGDLNGDGNDEFLVADGVDGGGASTYYLYGSAGKQLATGTITGNSKSLQTAKVAIGDIDGDNAKEAVFAGEDATNDGTYQVLIAKWSTTTSNLSFLACSYSDTFTWSNHILLPLVCFNPVLKETSVQDKIFVEEHILSYDTTTLKLSATSDSVAEAYRDCAVAGDFNEDGKDELAFPYYKDRNLYVYGNNSSGSWTKLSSTDCNEDTAYYTSMCAADVRGNSVVVSFQSRALTFPDPQVVAVLASPPYYAADVDSGSLSNYSTSFGTSAGSSSSSSKSFSVNASFSVGFSTETPLWGSAASVEAKATFGASFTHTASTTKETTVTKTYSTPAGEDLVIISCIPIDVYTYTVLRSANEAALPETITVKVPRTPQVIPLEKSVFNALTGHPITVNSSVLAHTLGTPSSYPSSTTIRGLIKTSTADGGGLWDPTGLTVGRGGGSETDEVTQSTTNETTNGVGFSYSAEVTVVAGGALFGTSYGFEGSYDYSVATSSGTVISGTIPNLPSTSTNAQFTYGIAAYQTTATGQTAPFLVVTYWVK